MSPFSCVAAPNLSTPQQPAAFSFQRNISNLFHLHHPIRFSDHSMRLFHPSSSIVKAVSSDGRSNLDHLQRQNKPPQQPVRRRSPQVRPIGLWDKFPTTRTVEQMMETMENLMEDPSALRTSNSSNRSGGGFNRGRTPWEIKESRDGDGYKMRFDMPGMTKQDVKLWVDEDKMLVLKAEKLSPNNNKKSSDGEEEEDEEEEWPAKSYGRYSCRIALPENVLFDKIKAEVKDGVLYITIPKARGNSQILDINVL